MNPGAAQARPGKAPGPTTGENPSGFLAPRAGRPAFSFTPGDRSGRLHLRLEKGRPRVSVRLARTIPMGRKRAPGPTAGAHTRIGRGGSFAL